MNIKTIYIIFLKLLIHNRPVTYTTFLLKKKQKHILNFVINNTPKKLIEYDPKCRIAHRIFWIINNITDFPKCANNSCLNNVTNKLFINIHIGYLKHCCCKCSLLDINTKNNFRMNPPMRNNKLKMLTDLTKIKRYGNKNNYNKIKTTRLLNNNGKYFSNEAIKSIIKKHLQNNNGKYMSDEHFKKLLNAKNNYYLSDKFKQNVKNGFYKEISRKGNITKKQNNTFNKSKIEDIAFLLLLNVYPNLIRQYTSKLYPFNCDFYDPDNNLYIEYNGHWTHGKHAFNYNNKDDINIINQWKNKNTKFYNNAITTWTIRDVNKRNIAIKK